MKVNSTVALTLMLLALMVGAGMASAMWGVALGREALKGVTQPDTRPTNNLAKRGANSRREEFTILREDDIIAGAKSRISGKAKDGKASESTTAKNASAKTDSSKAAFPMVSESESVVLEISDVRRQGDSLVMQVSLRNGGNQPVRFLYSFLSVTDDKGQELSVTANGLPSDLPSSSETYSGTVKVPVTLLEGVEKVSLSLTDYPDQKLDLALTDIPVPR